MERMICEIIAMERMICEIDEKAPGSAADSRNGFISVT